ncbi:L-lactate dehydrogenase [Candidatus Peregrinibacteria bacterium]|nr:L-lactate dehydrogenase [Candidatus Peregrinibacteria bacterium]
MTTKLINESNFRRKFKVSIIGAGNVGASAAYAILLDGTPTELCIVDIDKKRVEGLLLDYNHALSFIPYTKVTGGDNYTKIKDSDLVVVTAGARQKEGETRLDLIDKNKKIFQSIIPKIVKNAPNAVICIVSNPVDALTYEAIKLAKLPKGRVFGSGTWLDTSRFKFHIGEKIKLNPKSINAYILGEHGDSSFPVISSANIAGKPLLKFKNFNTKTCKDCYQEARDAAYRIINDIGFTSYSIGVVIKEIMLAIFENSHIVAPLSVKLDKYHGISDVCLSVPCVLGNEGIVKQIEVPLDKKEKKLLKKSAEILKSYNK